MELRHLRYFSVLADELHFGRAAQRLFISQPSLSNQIGQLEKELGVRLLQRTRRRVQLTEPGRLFLEKALQLLFEADQAVELAQLAERGQIGYVMVGFVDPAALTVLPLAVQHFRQSNPNVGLELHLMSSREQIAALHRHQIDVAIVRGRREFAGGVDLTSLLQEGRVAALPSGHPLLQRHVLSLEDLAHQPLIISRTQRLQGEYEELSRYWQQEGLHAETMESPSVLSTLGLTASGMGIGILPMSTSRLSYPNVEFRLIDLPMPKFDLSVAVRIGEMSRAVLEFRTVVKAVAERFDQTIDLPFGNSSDL